MRLVKLTYRTDPEKLPLRGKESQLLDVLNIARQRHDALLEQHQTFHELQAGFDAARGFIARAKVLEVEWKALSPTEQEWLSNLIFEDVVADDYLSAVDPSSAQRGRLARVEMLFNRFTSVSAALDDLEKCDHRPEELVALKAFIDELKTFWKSEACDEKFYIPHSGAEKMSSASKLVLAAAQALGQGYTLTKCDSALRPRLSKKSDKHRARKVNKKRALNRG